MTLESKRRVEVWLPIFIQTLLFLGALVGLAIAMEHRLTVVEECGKTTSETLQQTVSAVQVMQQTQIRVVTLLAEIERRHAMEDSRR